MKSLTVCSDPRKDLVEQVEVQLNHLFGQNGIICYVPSTGEYALVISIKNMKDAQYLRGACEAIRRLVIQNRKGA